jgi:hypothetical protein
MEIEPNGSQTTEHSETASQSVVVHESPEDQAEVVPVTKKQEVEEAEPSEVLKDAVDHTPHEEIMDNVGQEPLTSSDVTQIASDPVEDSLGKHSETIETPEKPTVESPSDSFQELQEETLKEAQNVTSNTEKSTVEESLQKSSHQLDETPFHETAKTHTQDSEEYAIQHSIPADKVEESEQHVAVGQLSHPLSAEVPVQEAVEGEPEHPVVVSEDVAEEIEPASVHNDLKALEDIPHAPVAEPLEEQSFAEPDRKVEETARQSEDVFPHESTENDRELPVERKLEYHIEPSPKVIPVEHAEFLEVHPPEF